MARGEHTRAAKIQKAEEREEKLVVLQLACDYARGHKIGARATVTTQLFPGVTYSMLHNALNNKIKALLGERYATDILTVDEGSKLEEWIAACARGKSPRRRPTRRPRSCVQRSTSASRTAPAVWCHARTRRCSCARRAATSRSSSAARARVWQRASRCG